MTRFKQRSRLLEHRKEQVRRTKEGVPVYYYGARELSPLSHSVCRGSHFRSIERERQRVWGYYSIGFSAGGVVVTGKRRPPCVCAKRGWMAGEGVIGRERKVAGKSCTIS